MGGQVQVQANTNAENPNTGSIRVMGGLSAGGSIYAGGNFVATSTDTTNDNITDVLILGKSTKHKPNNRKSYCCGGGGIRLRLVRRWDFSKHDDS